MTPLDSIRDLVNAVVDGHFTEAEALDALRVAGRNPNPEALEDAVTLTQARDGLIGGSVDPLEFLGVGPAIGFDSFEAAVTQADAGIVWAVAHLAQRPKVEATT